MSNVLYINVYSDAPEGESGEWKRADVILNGEIVATGFAPVRPPYTIPNEEGIVESSAISLAQNEFARKILGADIRRRR